jgi:hypothetical protein
MADVYRNAVVTLAAVDAPDSSAGFLSKRELNDKIQIEVNWTG